MRKATFKALEKLFAAEMSNRWPVQFRAKIYSCLRDEGFVELTERYLGADRYGQIVGRGWVLTHKGRREYCEECSKLVSE